MTARRQFIQGGVAATVGFAAGAVSPIGNCTGSKDADTIAPTTADIGFCSDMSAHHLQALVLCQRVLGRDTGDPVQAAAAEVLQNQSIEVGMMRAWLADWGESTAPPVTVMAWMGMNDGAGMPLAMMPGLASPAELQQLSTTDGMAQGRIWLELMRSHHVGGVTMASAAIERASVDKVIQLAETQAEVQTYEISQYDYLLANTYA